MLKKTLYRMGICFLLAAGVVLWTFFRDRQALQQELIRLHVVAASDSRQDQMRKLRVRDAVMAGISEDLEKIGDPAEARAYLRENLPRLQRLAETTLKALGCEDWVRVVLDREVFPRVDYDTFSLPAGSYDALRVTIGEGQGRNWWCVCYPGLCLPAAGAEVEALAEDRGLPHTAAGAITGKYRLRFYFLDLLGRLLD